MAISISNLFFFIIFNLKAAWARRGKTQWSLTECEQRRLLKPQAFMCFATPLLISSYADRKTSFYFHLWNLFLFTYIYSHSSFKRRHIAKISTEIFTWSKFKDQEVLPWETLWESFMFTCYNWLFTIWPASKFSSKICFFLITRVCFNILRKFFLRNFMSNNNV